MWLSIGSYGLLLPFAAAGLVLGLRRRRREALLVALVCAVFTAVHALYIAKVRLRLPLDLFVLIYGAQGLLGALGVVLRRR
jgi:hypothetical protein